jgi:hypothetical protein
LILSFSDEKPNESLLLGLIRSRCTYLENRGSKNVLAS